jgi:hypothetical protein
MNTKMSFLAAAVAIMFIVSCACGNRGNYTEPSSFESGKLTITFDYAKQSGSASNQFAVWLEDMDGNYINTLYATGYTAGGGFKRRPDSIPAWVEKSRLAEMEAAAVDSISGATPKPGTLSYAWDLKDAEGNTVPPGDYKFFVEGSLRWKNRVIYSGVITLGDSPSTAEATAEYIYEGSDNQPALAADSAENSMLGAVTANYEPSPAA